MAEIGTCGNDPCGQVDLLAYDGYCSESCRQQAEEGGEDKDPYPSGPPPRPSSQHHHEP
jgi:hypothetical protein